MSTPLPIMDNVSTEFVVKLSEHLSNDQTDEAITLFHSQKYTECLKNASWDVIPIISQYFVQETVIKSPKLFSCCETLLKEIANTANAEEALLEFLEQAVALDNDVKFLVMLKPLQIVLFRLPKRRGHSLKWCLNTIKTHMKALSLPDNHILEENQRKLMDADPSVKRITDLYLGIIPFYKPLVCEVSLQHEILRDLAPHLENVNKQRNILTCFILQLLGKPLAYLDLGDDELAKSSSRSSAEELVSCMCLLVGDILMLLEYADGKEIESVEKKKLSDSEDSLILEDSSGLDEESLETCLRVERVPVLSVAVFYYLVLGEGVCAVSSPCVYSPVFVFMCSLQLATTLLRKTAYLLVYKGLILAQVTMTKLTDKSLAAATLGLPIHHHFTQALTNVMVYCEVREYRKVAVSILQVYLFKFDTKGRYLLLCNLRRTINHSGLIGFIITQLKDIILEELKETLISPYFSCKYLSDLVGSFCCLPNGAESDLVEIADEVISALNLVRFLALRDRDNRTGIWDSFALLETTFFQPLRNGLNISRAHYQLKLKEIDEEKKRPRNVTNSDVPEVTISLGGQQLSNLPHDNKVAIIYSALNAFDLMESLLGRVSECIDHSNIKQEFQTALF